ncbi:hypothetical protein NDU88_001492 [Pleurodeles waltl]|uniref:Uncharacterized protein n=1 Tax=Pleurodeles waltl TaxID=8319 RepID=A0AAV7T0B1_PLEWA|nr:hypothetical protein NDU88_001492 [Pleurodeles waltl]
MRTIVHMRCMLFRHHPRLCELPSPVCMRRMVRMRSRYFLHFLGEAVASRKMTQWTGPGQESPPKQMAPRTPGGSPLRHPPAHTGY